MSDLRREYDRTMLRSEYQSLFWSVLLARKHQAKFTLKALADKLGINKSYISRSFSSPPNWQIDKIADMADALGVEMMVQARDTATGIIFTSSGFVSPSSSWTDARSNEGQPNLKISTASTEAP